MEEFRDPAVFLLDLLSPALEIFGDHVYLQATVMLALTVVVAKLIDLLLSVFVRRLVNRSSTDVDDQIVAMLHRPVFLSVIILGVVMITYVIGLHEAATDHVIALLRTLAVWLWMVFLIKLSTLLLREMAMEDRFTAVQMQSLPLFQNLSIVVIVSFAIYLVFHIWDIDMSAWLASAGIIGIAVGFAAKDTLANLFSGVFIMADAPYKIGDFIVLDSGERGQVTNIGIRSTRLLTRDDVEVTIPNAIMGNTKIINESGGPYEKFRIRVKISVGYGSDIEQVKDTLLEIASGNLGVCENPAPRVRFRGLGQSGLDLELLCWVEQPVLRGRILDRLYTRIYQTFMERGIEIPYNKRDLYIKEMPASAD
ncbi:MAG: mechanosensitive ion channel family protein [bacterium]